MPEAARYDIESSLFKREVKDIPCGPGKEEVKNVADGDEEDEDDKQFHELCKGSEVEPLQEPRFGLRYWSDAVPREVGGGKAIPVCGSSVFAVSPSL